MVRGMLGVAFAVVAAVTSAGADSYKLTGDTFTLKAEFKIDRADYGMTYGKGMVDDDVAIKVDLKAKK